MLKIYHNNRCSKSREALKILTEQGVVCEVIHYLEQPAGPTALRLLLAKLGFSSARQLMRTKEDEYQQLGLDDPALSEEELLLALATHPRLMERPVIEWPDKAIIARPPELLLDFLS